MSNKEILIVEDDPSFRASIRFALRNEGYTFFEAGFIAQGISSLGEHPGIQVIMLDLSLGNETGGDFLEQIRERASKYRVIILTEHEEKLAAEQAREFGVFTYLPKATRAFTQSIRFSAEQAFKDIERELLKEEREKWLQEKEQLIKKTEDLLAIQLKINSDQPLNDVLNLICQTLLDLVGAYTCHIRVYNLRTGDFDLAAFAGPSVEIRNVLDVPKRKGDLFSCKVAETKSPHLFEDLQDDEAFKAFRDELLQRPSLHEKARTYLEAIHEAYIAPITTNMFADETDAIFNISADSVNFFSEEKQKVVNEFVTQATIAITKAWQKQRKSETHKDYQDISKVLEKISEKLSEENSEKEIYDIVVAGIAEIVRPETISIFLHNKATDRLDTKVEFRGTKTMVPSPEGHPTDVGLTGWVFNQGVPLRIPNLQRNDRHSPQQHPSYSKDLEKVYIPDVPSEQATHYLGIPMQIGGEVIGVIQLLNKKSKYHGGAEDKQCWLLERGFSDDCEGVMSIAASYLAVAIKNAELIGERNRKISQLETLKDVGRYTTSSEITLDQLLEIIIKDAAEDVQAEICLLFLSNEGKNQIILEQAYGISIEDLKGADNKYAHYEIGEGLTGEVARTGASILQKAEIPSGKYDEKIESHLRQHHSEDKTIESLMVVPIRAKDEVIGVIKAINKKGDVEQYNQEDLSFFEAFANYVGIAIENAKRTNEKLAIAEKNVALSHLVRAVVHEINNTKALIPINVQMIRDRVARSGHNIDVKDMVDVIEDSAARAVKFANSIQAFSAGRIGKREAQNINTLIRKAIQQLTPGLQRSDKYRTVRLVENLPDELPACSVYEIPFVQVISNIILNAYQAMEKSREKVLTITSYEDAENHSVNIDIADTGHGMPGDILEKIFDPEFTIKEGRGTGIGLWLAKTHLDSIDARIKVLSVVNKGTTFTIEIPIIETEVSEAHDGPAS